MILSLAVTQHHYVWLDPKYVRQVYGLFAGGALPGQGEVERVLLETVRSVLEQIPAFEGMDVNAAQEGGEA